jgi:hypothetical protein
LSILEFSRHELHIAHGLTLMTPSLRGWEAFPMPGALAHTRITWAFSPPAPQVPGVTPGSPLCPWCFGHPLWRGARHIPSVATLASSLNSLGHSSLLARVTSANPSHSPMPRVSVGAYFLTGIRKYGNTDPNFIFYHAKLEII